MNPIILHVLHLGDDRPRVRPNAVALLHYNAVLEKHQQLADDLPCKMISFQQLPGLVQQPLTAFIATGIACVNSAAS